MVGGGGGVKFSNCHCSGGLKLLFETFFLGGGGGAGGVKFSYTRFYREPPPPPPGRNKRSVPHYKPGYHDFFVVSRPILCF